MNVKLLFHFSLVTMLTMLTMVSCRENSDSIEKQTDRSLLIEDVRSQVKSFRQADIELNSEKIIDLLWPEFTMLADGNYLVYQDVVKGSHAFMASLEVFKTDWNDLRIIPLGENHAISSFIFVDSLVSKDGTVNRSRGPNTFVWERRDSLWKVLYADADHYPIE